MTRQIFLSGVLSVTCLTFMPFLAPAQKQGQVKRQEANPLYYPASDFTMMCFAMDPILCNPLEYLVSPGSYVYHNVLECLYTRRHSAKEWQRVAGKIPVFDSVSIIDRFDDLSKHRSLYKENYYADSLLVSCKRGYKYYYDSSTQLPIEIRQNEQAVWLRGGKKDSVLYDGYPMWRTFCFYDDNSRLTGVLNQRCQTVFDETRHRFDPSTISVRSDDPGSRLNVIYRGDTIVLMPFYSISDNVYYDSLDHVYSGAIPQNTGWDEDSFNYQHYRQRWNILSARAALPGEGPDLRDRTTKHWMKLYFDAAKGHYHVCYYYLHTKTKEMVYDGQLNRLYSLSVFDNSISHQVSSLPFMDKVDTRIDHITGGIGVRYDGYYNNAPATLIATNYRITYTTGNETKKRTRSNDFETVQETYQVPLEHHYDLIAALPTLDTLFRMCNTTGSEGKAIAGLMAHIPDSDSLMRLSVSASGSLDIWTKTPDGQIFTETGGPLPVHQIYFSVCKAGRVHYILLNRGYSKIVDPHVRSTREGIGIQHMCARGSFAFSLKVKTNPRLSD